MPLPKAYSTLVLRDEFLSLRLKKSEARTKKKSGQEEGGLPKKDHYQ